MNTFITQINDICHPLVASAYLKQGLQGNILVLETNLSRTHKDIKKHSLDALLEDLNELIEEIETPHMRLDLIDIRLNDGTSH